MSAKGSKEFNIEDRKKIQECLQKGLSYAEMAPIVGRPWHSIKQEVNRYGGHEKYNAEEAQKEANKRKALRFSYLLKNFDEDEVKRIRYYLAKGYSKTRMAVLMNCNKYALDNFITRNQIKPSKETEYLSIDDRVAALEQQIEILFEEIRKREKKESPHP